MLKISLYQDYNVPLCRHIKTQNYRTYQSNTIYGQSKYSINAEDNTDIGTLILGMVSLTEKKASLNGNISSIIWRDSTQTASRGYRFTYDSMNRLTDAVYGEGPSLSDNTDRYSERGMTYTKNGALTRLLRYGRRNTDDFGLIDSLAMTLDGNRVLSVEDGAGRLVYENSFDFKHKAPKPYEKPAVNRGSTYQYDGNGRLDYDPDKRVQLSYDLAGNPKRFECGSVLEYVYSSTGEKLCQFHNPLISVKKPPYLGTDTGPVNTTGTLQSILHENDYVRTYSFLLYDRDKKLSHLYCTGFNGPFIILRGILDKFLFDGGYCTFKDGQASFHYYLQDHLGNNRAVVSEAGTMEQTTEYYPFGGIYGDVSTNPGLQLYKYNGKEFDHSLGLDLYDYGARLYDPALVVVWTGGDPLVDEYGGISPYAYCGNNPVNAIDPDGKKLILVGTWEQRMLILRQMQKLTNDKLGMKRNTGEIIIMNRGSKNLNRNLKTGSSLISSVISNEHTATIGLTTNSSHAHRVYRLDAINGKGTDTQIWYNIEVRPFVLTKDEGTGKINKEAIPSQIVLGHELIHGLRSMNGTGRHSDIRKEYKYTDTQGGVWSYREKQEELETVGILSDERNREYTENNLRKEQHLNIRIKY